MNNETVLAALADLIRPRLSDSNPLKEALFATVAEQKDDADLHTYAVLQTSKSQSQELVPGNFTWRYPCRLQAFFFPPEDEDYSAANIDAWMEEAGLALVAACSTLLEGGYDTFLPLDAVVNGPINWAPSATGGFEGSVNFTLTIQF